MATPDFTVEGRSFAGFPLLLDNDGWPLEPAQSFLWHTLVTHGSIEPRLSISPKAAIVSPSGAARSSPDF